MNRIMDIVNYLLENPEDFVSVYFGSACLLNVSNDEWIAIKSTFTTSNLMEKGM